MKVRIISNSNYKGGAARAAARLNRSLFKYGLNFKSDMQVANYRSDINNVIKPSSKFTSAWFMARRQLGNIIQKAQISENKVLHSTSLLKSSLHKEINKCDADLINLHWVQGEFISIKSISLITKPIVWTLHDLWPFLGSEHYPKDINDRRYIEGYSKNNRSRNEKGFDLDLLTWKVKKHFFKKPVQIVCCSNWLASCVRSSALMNSWPVEVIPNPLPTSIYKPWPKQNCRELFNLPLDKDLILFGALGGTEDPRKGWQYLKVALKKISFKNNNAHAIIFGQYEPKEKPDIGIPITYVGELQDDQSLAMLYSAADVMVVPSTMENLPQSATEAQSCGVPVVAFNCTGLVDVVEDRTTGYLAKPFDSNDLSFGIEWVLNKDNYKSLCLESRKRAERLWKEEIITMKYEEIYNKVLGQ